MLQVQVERGLPFDEAQAKLETDLCEKEGFYKAKKVIYKVLYE